MNQQQGRLLMDVAPITMSGVVFDQLQQIRSDGPCNMLDTGCLRLVAHTRGFAELERWLDEADPMHYAAYCLYGRYIVIDRAPNLPQGWSAWCVKGVIQVTDTLLGTYTLAVEQTCGATNAAAAAANLLLAATAVVYEAEPHGQGITVVWHKEPQVDEVIVWDEQRVMSYREWLYAQNTERRLDDDIGAVAAVPD